MVQGTVSVWRKAIFAKRSSSQCLKQRIPRIPMTMVMLKCARLYKYGSYREAVRIHTRIRQTLLECQATIKLDRAADPLVDRIFTHHSG